MVNRGSISQPYKKFAFKHQADAVLTQAAPVQNTYYTLLDTTLDVRVINVAIMVATANETLNARVTVDGVVTVGESIAATFNTWYYGFFRASDGLFTFDTAATVVVLNARTFEAQSLKIEIRKTTAAGAGNLNGRVIYETLEAT